jgi:hypothetical protein
VMVNTADTHARAILFQSAHPLTLHDYGLSRFTRLAILDGLTHNSRNGLIYPRDVSCLTQ